MKGRELFPDQMNRSNLDLILGRHDRNVCIKENLRYLNSALNEIFQESSEEQQKTKKEKKIKQSINPIRNTNNSFTVFLQMLNVN